MKAPSYVYRLRSWLSEVWRLGAALRRRNNLPIDLFMLMNAHFLERALFVAAELGIADLLRDGPKALSELSTLTNTDASMLGRILRALESFGLFAEDEAGRFRLTEVGERLRSDHPSSYRHWIRYLGGMWFQAASAMPESVRTGRNGWDLAFGMPAWEHLARFPAVREIFDRGMSVWTALHTPEILKAYDFSRFRELVDVGGNKGTLLTSILAAHRGLRGVVFDREEVGVDARKTIEAAGLANRCTFKSGDFMVSVPAADGYIMKHALHDWDDAAAARVLGNIRSAALPGARILVVDAVLGRGPRRDRMNRWLDLAQIAHGGRERTRTEFEALFQRAGLRLVRVTHTFISDVSILETVPA